MTYRSDPLLEWCKAKAEYKRERLDRWLSREPVSQRQTWRRKVFVERALRSVEKRKARVEAYDGYLTELLDVLARAAPPISTLSDTGSRGDLGE